MQGVLLLLILGILQSRSNPYPLLSVQSGTREELVLLVNVNRANANRLLPVLFRRSQIEFEFELIFGYIA